MDLRFVMKLIVKNAWIFVFTSLLSLSFATYTNSTSISLYRSSMDLFVSTPVSSVDLSSLATGSNFGTQRVKSYAQIINSSYTMNEVIRNLSLPISASDLATKVSASAPLDTVIITVSVTDRNPELAKSIADTIGVVFAQQVDRLELLSVAFGSPINVSVVKEATLPSVPFYPKKSLNLILALCFSFLVSFSFGFLRFIRDDRVKNESDILGIPLVGVFELEPASTSQLILNRDNTFSKRAELFRQIRATLVSNFESVQRSSAKIVSICSAVSGEGKSTTALDLSITLAQSGLKVLLVEADLRKPSLRQHLITGFGSAPIEVEDGNSILDFLSGSKVIPLTTDIELLNVLLCNRIPVNPAELLSDEKVRSLISCFHKNYDVILFDTPPLLPVSDAANVVSNSDFNILVVQAGSTRKIDLQQCIKVLGNYKSMAWGVILNKVPRERFLNEYGYGYGYGYGMKSAVSNKYYAYRPDDSYYRRGGDEVVQRREWRIIPKRLSIKSGIKSDGDTSSTLNSENQIHSSSDEWILKQMQILLSTTAKKTTAKKTTAKKATAKKTTAKKTTAKKTTAKKKSIH